MNERGKNISTSSMSDSAIEFRKILILAVCFFFAIGGYTIVHELKDFVFVSIVGLPWVNLAKIISVIVLIPLVFIYSRLVDLLRRHQLIYLYVTAYAVGGLICAYFLGHPTIGLPNAQADGGRWFGWIFYFFLEGYMPFVVSLLWAFVSTVIRSDEVKNGYVIITASSKVGGALAAGAAWFFLLRQDSPFALFSYVASYQFLLIIASGLLLCVPFIIYYLMRVIPASHLHGYEAAYRLEKEMSKKEQTAGFKGTIQGMFAGLWLLLRYPYTLGIFGMIAFWEVINVIFNYIRLTVGQASTHSGCEFGAYLFQQMCFMHLVGFFVVIIGTKTFIEWFGERRSLIAVPLLLGTVISYYLVVQTAVAATICYVVMRAIHYAFAYPLSESLYIPTTKAVRFKTKSWIDGFGAKLSKTFGSFYNIVISNVAASSLFLVHAVFFVGIIGLWMTMAHFLGKRFEKAIEKDEVIGTEEAL